ncbi:MAG: hypothetical protein SFV53_06790 [Rickettsiales bacterium]|nr:hypothetical protein [Rickettsiales bacterium]
MPFYSNENSVIALMQYIVLWISLFFMLVIFILLFRADFKAPQRLVDKKIDIQNKVNICLPEPEKTAKDN